MDNLISRINNRSLKLFLLCACLNEGVSFAISPVETKKKPNVLIILTDDQGALDAGCYGSSDL